MPLTTAEANALLNASTLAVSYPYTTGPTRLALLTAVSGTPATTAGTEVSGGSGPYSRQVASFSVAANGTITNNSTITFTGMPACTVVAVEIYDSATTPNRKWYGNLTASRTLQAGDSLSLASNALSLQLI